jgi:hypothetical protein
VTVTILEYNLRLPGQITRADFSGEVPSVQIHFDQLELAQHRCLVEMLFCRPGQWKRVHLNLARAKHSGKQFISEKQRFTAGMLRPYEYICKTQMHPLEHRQ